MRCGNTQCTANRPGIAAVAVVLTLMACLSPAGETASSARVEPGEHRTASTHLTWNGVSSIVNCPRDICSQVRLHLRSMIEAPDHWASPRQIWERGYADNSDFAACVKELCDRKGFQAGVYVFYAEDGEDRFIAQVAVMGSWNGELWVSINGSWDEAQFFDGIRSRVASLMNWQLRDTRVITLVDMAEDKPKIGFQGHQMAENRR